jgi:ribosomal protein L7/L12
MFVRFRQTKCRLQVSLIETRRIDGRVRHEHIASLGSVPAPPSLQDRMTFWQRLHEQLSRLANRVTDAAKVLGAIHARIPMVTPDEIQAAKIEAAEADERFWSGLHEMHTQQMEGHGQLVAKVEGKIAVIKIEAEKTAAEATEAKDRVERLKRGEDVASGLAKPDAEKMLRDIGWTTRDINNARWLVEVCDAFGDEKVFKLLRGRHLEAGDREDRRIVRRLKRELDRMALAPATPDTSDRGGAE